MTKVGTKSVYDRWVSIFTADVFRRTLRQAQRLGIGLIDGWKPDMCCWYSLRFKATPEQMQSLQAWWAGEGIEWFNRMPRGAWKARGQDVLDWDEVMAKLGR